MYIIKNETSGALLRNSSLVKRIFLNLYIFFAVCFAQPFQFALVADTHVGSTTGQADLELSVTDINQQTEIDFVILAGDLTEFGSDQELRLARQILDRLDKPWYVVPGNHDAKWSESGSASFVRLFGSTCFSLNKNGFLFIGTASGPDMRMSLGLVPKEQLDFVLHLLDQMEDKDQPIIFINHYPLNEELANASLVIDLLKRRNIQVCLFGHGHRNKLTHFTGIPGIMGRSNLRGPDRLTGYNIVRVDSQQISVAERTSGGSTQAAWCQLKLANHHFDGQVTARVSAERAVSPVGAQANWVWRVIDSSNIGTGITMEGHNALYANTHGEMVNLDSRTGQLIWKYRTKGKIFSTPAIGDGRVVCAGTDSLVYCLSLKSGKPLWQFKSGKSMVASPLIHESRVYIGSSEGLFRCLDLKNGRVLWQNDGIKNFVEAKPLFYQDKIYFGSWGNTFYALEGESGALVWKREKYSNRMLSPAAVQPVASHDKIFIVAPDRRMTALDAATGRVVWDSDAYSCRESIGLSQDGQWVYIKTMKEGNLCVFRTDTTAQVLVWQTSTGAGYEIAPTPILEHDGLVFMGTTRGILYAIDKHSQDVAWRFQVADALIYGICPAGKGKVLVTTIDGVVGCISYHPE